MKRSGFTMIELVFVIVILGILAAVAIPKLAATRDDAQIAKATSEVTSLIQDFGSYYTAHGSFAKVSDATNVALYTDTTGTTKADTQDLNNSVTPLYYVDTKRGADCLKITVNDTNGTLTIEKGSGPSSSIFCKGLANALEENGMLDKDNGGTTSKKTYSFGGSSIYN